MNIYKLHEGNNLSNLLLGNFYNLLKFMNNKNEIILKRSYPTTENLLVMLKINDKPKLSRVLNGLQKVNFIYHQRKNNKKIILLNPIYIQHDNFKWYKEIFDIFEDSIKYNLSEFEYLKLKSNWYTVDHQITIDTFSELEENISGIYKLYKNTKVVYIGKSLNVKNRVREHKKDKDFDEFQFTISNNESDKNILEVYLIDKYKPLLNKDCIENFESTIEIKEPVFSKKIKF